jgi:hypothetical protein
MDITSTKHSGVDHKIVTATGTLNSSGSAATMIVGSSGYVALLDVLGFRELVAADRNNVRIIEYLGIVENSPRIPGIVCFKSGGGFMLTHLPRRAGTTLLCRGARRYRGARPFSQLAPVFGF